jgi:CRP-like cAMP-binding protein
MSSARPTQECNNLRCFNLLRESIWFGELPYPTAKELFTAGHCVEYPAGQLIYLEDSPYQGIFGVLEGTVHFETIDNSGRRILLNLAGPGHWFGDVAASVEGRTTVSAYAFRRVKAWHVPVFALRRLLRDLPELRKAYEQLTAMRISTLVERICVMHRPSALVQVAGTLALLRRTLQETIPSTSAVFIDMTQSDLADMTGLSRQTINGIIGQLEAEGLIKVNHRKIAICDPDALENYYLSKTSGHSMPII